MQYNIRFATHKDLPEIIDLCSAHSEYEQAVYSPSGKAEKLAKMLFGDNPPLFCLIAENENEVLGYATFSKECSTWNADFYVHLDCLFLREKYRGYGIGEAFIQAVVQQAQQMQATHIEWQTPVFNERAIKFYHRIGASAKAKQRFTLHLS